MEYLKALSHGPESAPWLDYEIHIATRLVHSANTDLETINT